MYSLKLKKAMAVPMLCLTEEKGCVGPYGPSGGLCCEVCATYHDDHHHPKWCKCDECFEKKKYW